MTELKDFLDQLPAICWNVFVVVVLIGFIIKEIKTWFNED